MEFVIEEQTQLQPIKFNNEALKEYLTEQLKKYKTVTYSEESIGTAKADKAALNKLRTAIEDKRKEIKRECMEPYNEFETKVKELVALIDEPILMIDTQVKEYENAKKEEKKADIEAIYTEKIGDLIKLLPLSKFWNEKWLNVTYTIKNIEIEIAETIDKVTDDIQVITDFGSGFELQIKDKYLQTLDLSAALKEKTRLEEQKIKMEEYSKQQEQNRLEAEEEQKAVIGTTTPIVGEIAHTEPPQAENGIGEEVKEVKFTVCVNKAEWVGLYKYMKENKIKFEVGK